MTFPESEVCLAHTQSLNPGNDETILIEFDNEGALVTWPRSQSLIDVLNSTDSNYVPEPLIARTSKGWVTLNDGVFRGSSSSSLSHSELRFRYRHAINAGRNGKDYSEINGLTSKNRRSCRMGKNVADRNGTQVRRYTKQTDRDFGNSEEPSSETPSGGTQPTT